MTNTAKVKRPKTVRYPVSTHGTHVPRRIILHDTESHDHKGISDIMGIAAFWKHQDRGLGSQFIVDSEGIIGQGAWGGSICYHTANHNTGSIGIEQIGFARWSGAAWMDRRKQLNEVAHLVAYLSDYWDIPLLHSTDHGVCMHRDFKGDHTDPGVGYAKVAFPYVLRRARQIKRAAYAI